MSRLLNFLKTLTDFELAQFYKFRYNQFLPGSKDKILSELKERGMDINSLNSYRQNKRMKTESAQCPKCHSNKFYTASEVETIEFMRSTIEVDEYYKTCLVCLFSEEKPENYERHKLVSFFEFLRMRNKTRK